jgi:hypothetical protein
MPDTLQRVARWLGALAPEDRAHWEKYLASAKTPEPRSSFVEALARRTDMVEAKSAREAAADTDKQREAERVAAALAKELRERPTSHSAAARRTQAPVRPATYEAHKAALKRALPKGEKTTWATAKASVEAELGDSFDAPAFQDAWSDIPGADPRKWRGRPSKKPL